MGIFDIFGGDKKQASKSEPEVRTQSALDIVKTMGKRGSAKDDDDYEFEDIEEIRKRHGFKHGNRRQAVVSYSWGEIALGTATSCATMGAFGALMGLAMGAITGPIFAPSGQRLPVTIGLIAEKRALMKKQAVWFGVIFGGGGGIIGAIRRYG